MSTPVRNQEGTVTGYVHDSIAQVAESNAEHEAPCQHDWVGAVEGRGGTCLRCHGDYEKWTMVGFSCVLPKAPQKQDTACGVFEASLDAMHNYPRKVDLHTPPHFRYPSTTDELLEFGHDFFAGCLKIAEERNKRYAGAYDPFKNFRLGEDYGIAIRMTDKVSRLITLLHPSNTTDDAGESISDTCIDLANYAMLLCALRNNERGGG